MWRCWCLVEIFCWYLVKILKMKCDQDLCLNFWYDFKKLLWQDELNPRVRCAFGNVILIQPSSWLGHCIIHHQHSITLLMWKFFLGHIFGPVIYMWICSMANIHLKLNILIKYNKIRFLAQKWNQLYYCCVVNYFIVKPMRYVVKLSYGNY